MAQEFTIKSESIESKINELLPTQGGFQPGVDFSASTMIVPIVDLTQTAEGTDLPSNLQQAMSLDNTSFRVDNATTTVISTPGFYKCNVVASTVNAAGASALNISITDGFTSKILFDYKVFPLASGATAQSEFIVCVGSGQSVVCTSTSSNEVITFTSRQVATINGTLVNPTAYQN